MSSDLKDVDRSKSRLLAVIDEIIDLKEPNQPIPGLEVSAVRDLALSIAEKIVSEGDVESLLMEAIGSLPDIDLDYHETTREALVVTSKIADLQRATFRHYNTIRDQKNAYSANTENIDAQISVANSELHAVVDNLSKLRDEIYNRIDSLEGSLEGKLSDIKKDVSGRTGVSLQLAGIGVDLDTVINATFKSIDLIKSRQVDLGVLKDDLQSIRGGAFDILRAAQDIFRGAYQNLLIFAERAAVSASKAAIAGLRAFQSFLSSQMDRTKVPPSAEVLDIPARQPVIVRNQDDISAWLKLNRSLEQLAERRLFSLPRDESDASALLSAGLIDEGFYNRIMIARGGLRNSMQNPRQSTSEYALATLRLIGELDRI